MDQELTGGSAGLYPERAVETSSSGVAWPAIIGGAVAGSAMSLVLVALGSGFGLASVSPWTNAGASITTFTVMTAIWLIVVQWVASGVSGYLTGRLRIKWAGLHTHEVFFRDTANGFLSWAVSSVVVAAFLASAVASVSSGVTQVAAGAATGASNPTGYLVDSLYRTDRPATTGTNQEAAAESSRILAMGLRNGEVPTADKTYLAQLVAARTGLSQADSVKRVDDVIAQEKAAETKARAAADAARKAVSYLSIFTALSMLIGAFTACCAAALGGQQRDEHR